ncbi:MAG: hypothetical protein BGO21_20200 [Dyadobacter sp. 50-39]|uniref:hypothetical protein n=1 Tax=Dyadobacter sp. 50-39 TaxID=1895756 RepID=UPI0009682599|nr:hypothetical protein [Dyadobacter sp. 50-39]OJV13935.1 MAG: hypothetical protein BGO21_20200 [Dyadobacter sp. 50-39]
MKKIRFFNSIFLESLDQRTTSILESHKTIVKQVEYELQGQQLKLDKKINEELDFLVTGKESAIIEYKLRQLYVVEKYISERSAFIARKSMLKIIISTFEEILIELRTILVNELRLLDQMVLQITESHQLHSTILNEIPVYSKTINSSWIQIKGAINIEPNINEYFANTPKEIRESVVKIKSIKRVKLKNEKEILALIDCNYQQDLIKAIEIYFIEMNDKINALIKK